MAYLVFVRRNGRVIVRCTMYMRGRSVTIPGIMVNQRAISGRRDPVGEEFIDIVFQRLKRPHHPVVFGKNKAVLTETRRFSCPKAPKRAVFVFPEEESLKKWGKMIIRTVIFLEKQAKSFIEKLQSVTPRIGKSAEKAAKSEKVLKSSFFLFPKVYNIYLSEYRTWKNRLIFPPPVYHVMLP